MKQLLSFALLGIPLIASSQQLYQVQRADIETRRANNTSYAMPYVGGLNNPQFSSCDLDNDGIRDLYVFDRTGSKHLAFRHLGGVGAIDYSPAPTLLDHFPPTENWALLRDYNCDGIEDLFTYSAYYPTGDVGIKVYRGSRNADQQLEFTLITNLLKTAMPNSSTLKVISVGAIDIPAFDDIDSDGDLDILTFHPSGGYVEWFSNQSIELGYNCDSLLFLQRDDCWGRFYENGVSEYLDLSPSIDSCPGKVGWAAMRNGLHAGSTVLTIDMDNDGDKELFLGDLAFNNLSMLTNGGNADTAFITAQQPFFPALSTPVDLHLFPAGFWVDVDNNGVKDLLVTPNSEANSENQDVVWYYNNLQTNATPYFDYQQSNFLSQQMIDFGSNASPTFVDYDQDGLTDMVVGNYGVFQGMGSYQSSLVFFKNIGTAGSPIFKITNTDVGGLQAYNLRYLAPTFGDMDADGDLDIVVGQEDGTLLFLENKGTAQSPSYPNVRPNYQLIDVGLNSSPTLGDLDNDGDLDLVVGERNGNFNYFENIGTPTVQGFTNVPTTATFGMIDTKTPGTFEGNAKGCLVKDANNKWQFYVGNTIGEVWHYDSLETNLLGTFRQVQDGVWGIDEGDFSAPTVADINDDDVLDIMVGNRRGGLAFWQYDTTRIVPIATTNSLQMNLIAFPNPAQDGIHLIWAQWQLDGSQQLDIRIFNMLGQQLLQENIVLNVNAAHWIPLSVPTGQYWLQASNTVGHTQVIPFIIR